MFKIIITLSFVDKVKGEKDKSKPWGSQATKTESIPSRGKEKDLNPRIQTAFPGAEDEDKLYKS